jgi:CspA family cold shock protein
MTSAGTVRVWHPEEGWGVIDSAATPGGCWAHFSAVLVAGYRALEAGAAVEFCFEAAAQDGCSFRAVEVWPAGQPPVRRRSEDAGGHGAYHSALTLTFDGEDPTGAP